MGLLKLLPNSKLGFKGEKPAYDSENPNSRLHKTYSINGIPNIKKKPIPSVLDLDGIRPKSYLDNPPK